MGQEIKTGHSEIGASGCHRWWECPGSVALIRKAPPQDSSKAAAEGTAAHELAEHALRAIKRGKQINLYSKIGETIEVEDQEFEITEDMADAVNVYLSAVTINANRFGTNLSFLSIEEQFQLDVDEDAWGRNDAFLYKPFDYIYLWDYKHGRGVVVEVENNKQLMYYALGALKNREDVQGVVTYIVQPRAYHPQGPVRKCLYSVADLKEFEIQLKVKIEATRKKDAPLKSGPHCKFCPATIICPEAGKATNEVAKRDFADVPTLPIDMMIKLEKLAPRIIDYLKEVHQHLQAAAERGTEVPGFKLVKGRSNRKWKSEQRIVNEFGKILGDEIFAKRKLLTPAQMEKKAKGKVEKDAFLPYIEKPDAGLTLVLDSDAREAVKSSAVKDFENV